MFIIKHIFGNLVSRFICLIIVCFSPNLQAQDSKEALENALVSYSQQDYKKIVVLLTNWPPELLVDKTQKIMAYDILAQAYFFNSQVDSAQKTLNRILNLQPDYDVQQPLYPQEYINIVNEVKENRARLVKKSLFRNKWLWFGSVAVSSVAAYLIFKKNEKKVLPYPPEPPGFR